MTVVWTEELKAKAKATREANKAAKAERLAKKLERQNGVHDENGDGGYHPESDPVSNLVPPTLPDHIVSVLPFDWQDSPLPEAQARLGDLKREYDQACAIVQRRQNPANHKWTCWTELHKNDKDAQGNFVIPASVRKECLRHGADGMWKFRDDGNFVMINGVRTLQSIFICNYKCYSVYQSKRVSQKIAAGV